MSSLSSLRTAELDGPLVAGVLPPLVLGPMLSGIRRDGFDGRRGERG